MYPSPTHSKQSSPPHLRSALNLPNPSFSNPSLPNPSLPNPSLPNPSLPASLLASHPFSYMTSTALHKSTGATCVFVTMSVTVTVGGEGPLTGYIGAHVLGVSSGRSTSEIVCLMTIPSEKVIVRSGSWGIGANFAGFVGLVLTGVPELAGVLIRVEGTQVSLQCYAPSGRSDTRSQITHPTGQQPWGMQ